MSDFLCKSNVSRTFAGACADETVIRLIQTKPHITEDNCCFEMENPVTTYKLPKDYFSEVYCTIILYLQSFQILKWRKVYGGHI